MQAYVGTSGWMYSWNPEQSLDWYLANSKLNAVELNASFYRFPTPSQVKNWKGKAKDLRFIIKVNRWVTHIFRFNPRALATWKKFHELFKPLDESIEFYLFQLPPSTKPTATERITGFFNETGLGRRFALEWRNKEWFKKEWVDWAKQLQLTPVSVDAPELPRYIFNVNGFVYLRMHGRQYWYAHHYTQRQLLAIKEKIIKAKPEKAYVMFNNNHDMLANARETLQLLTGR